MHAARNTQQALDWASKRRLQVERASRLRTERQALLKADHVNADDFDFADEEPAETARQVGAPIAGRRALQGPDDGSGRGASRPSGDMLPSSVAGGEAHADYQRYFSDQPAGRSGRRSVGAEGMADGEAGSHPLPEWAREMSAGVRPSRFVDGADGGGYDRTGQSRLSVDPAAALPCDPPSAGRSSRYSSQPDSFDWSRDNTHAAPAGQAARRGTAVRSGAAITTDRHEAAVAAAAARFPDDLPLTQSDGGIGFARQRNMPRAGPRDPPPPLLPPNAADFFGIGHSSPEYTRLEAPPAADDVAAAFFGLDANPDPEAVDPCKQGRPRLASAHANPPEATQPGATGGGVRGGGVGGVGGGIGGEAQGGAVARVGSGRTAAESLRLLPRRGSVHRSGAGGGSRRQEWNSDLSLHPDGAAAEYHDDSAGDSEISMAPTTAADGASAAVPRSAARGGRPPRTPAMQQPEWNFDHTGANALLAQPPPPVRRRQTSAGRRRLTIPDLDAGEFARPLEEVVAPRKAAVRGRRAEPKSEWDSSVAGEAPELGEGLAGTGAANRRPLSSASRRVSSAARRRDGNDGRSGPDEYGPAGHARAAADRSDRSQPNDRNERPVGRNDRPVGPAVAERDFGGGRDERPLPRALEAPPEEEAGPARLCQCDVCGRSFAEDRIAKHMVACEKSHTKVRKVFNPAKQRLQGLDNVNVKAGEREALKAAERRRELMRAAGAGYAPPLRPGGPHPPATDPRHVPMGKDGRPLSPLSAAVARAKAGEDPFDEDPNLLPSNIVPCPCCGRNFASDRLHIHLAICQKVAVNSQSRQVCDPLRCCGRPSRNLLIPPLSSIHNHPPHSPGCP